MWHNPRNCRSRLIARTALVALGLTTALNSVIAKADDPDGIVVSTHLGTTLEPNLGDDGPSFGVSIHGPLLGNGNRRLDWIPWAPSLRVTGSLSRVRRDDDALTLATLGPMLRWSLNGGETTVRLSVRPSFVSRSTLGGRDLGGPFQFTSGIAVSRAISQRWRLGVGLQHSSNARLYDANEGFNLVTIALEHSL